MKSKDVYLAILVLFCLWATEMAGQVTGRNPGHLEYENYRIAEGFPGLLTKECVQDSLGFIWIATWEGLVRYDGYDFKLFRPNPVDLADNVIQRLFLRKDGQIYCPSGKEVRLFDPKTEEFTIIDHRAPGEEEPPALYDVIEDDFGNIWMATAPNKGLRIIPKNNSSKDSIVIIKSIEGYGYHDSILKYLELVPESQIIGIRNMGNSVQEQKTFSLADSTLYNLVFFGEYSQEGSWLDEGWLENTEGDTIWLAEFNKSLFARAYYYGRMIIDQIKLPPGTYKLKFRSNESFSAELLAQYNHPWTNWWGISLINPEDKMLKKQLLKWGEEMTNLRKSERHLTSSSPLPLYNDQQGRIYVGTVRGFSIFSRHPEGKKIKNSPYPYVRHFTFTGVQDGALASVQVLEFTPYGSQQILISGYNNKVPTPRAFLLELFDPITEKFQQIPNSVSFSRKVTNTGWAHYINDMEVDRTGNIWLSGAHSGLYKIPSSHALNPNGLQVPTDSFFYQFHPNGMVSLIHDVMIDKNENIWLCTNNDYLYKLRTRTENIKYLQMPRRELDKQNLSSTIFSDKDEDIWLSSTDGFGIYHYDNTLNRFSVINAQERVVLKATFEDSQGRIWLSSEMGFVMSYDKRSAESRKYKIANSGFVTCHSEHRDGRLWVSDMQSNLSLLNPVGGSMEAVPLYSDSSKMGRWDGLSFLKEVGQDTFMVGYPTGGLGRLVIQNIKGNKKFAFKEFLPEKWIYALAKESSNRYWIGTIMQGLLLIDKQGSILKQYTTENGLLNNNIYELFIDQKERLWIHSYKGIQLFDIEREEFINLSYIQNLNNGGCTRCSHQNQSGKLYISEGEGVYILHPDSINIDSTSPTMVLKNLIINNQRGDLDTTNVTNLNVTYSNQMTLGYYENTIAISYAGIHYDNPKAHVYAHRLVGLNDQWQEVGKERVARYNKLPPGKYIFEVKAANADGVWTDEPATLQITILPPWFWNAWSKTLYGLVGIGIILFGYQFQLNRRLAEAEALRLSELDQVKTKLYTNITHEFRTPLTVISGMAEQVLEDPKQWFREGMDMIKRNSQQLLHLVNQMLDLSKLESGTMKVKSIQDDIVPFIRYVAETYQAMATLKGIQFQLQAKNEAIRMDFDPEKVQQIVGNLLSNAIKFTPEEGKVQLTLNQLEKSGQTILQIKVLDNGPGISKEEQRKIFDRFHQVDASSTRREEGTGIGLALTKEMVHLLGGEISLESVVGKGTTFRVELPITHLAEEVPFTHTFAPSSTATTWLAGSLPTLPKGDENEDPTRILLVEDNADVLQYLTSCLAKSYQLDMALNGRQGIDKAIAQIPDIIISDIMMPEKDGFELLQTLKQDERTSHIPIILLTAKADIASKLQGLRYGADAYLAKPFHPTELDIRIQNLIEIRKNLQLRYQKSQQIKADSNTINKPIMKEDPFLMKVRRSVEHNMGDEKFGIPELCHSLAISRTQLHRKLKAVTGQSTSHVVRSIRLKRAKQLLETSDLNVSEVGYAVGYTNSSHFTQDFRKEYGKPPREFKKG